jgi:hypothetical protein
MAWIYATNDRDIPLISWLHNGHVSPRLRHNKRHDFVITLRYLLINSRQPKWNLAHRSALANRDHNATGLQAAMSAAQTNPGGFSDRQDGIRPWPLSQAQQSRIFHPQSRLQPLCLLRSHRHGWFHNYDSGHIEQASRHA